MTLGSNGGVRRGACVAVWMLLVVLGGAVAACAPEAAVPTASDDGPEVGGGETTAAARWEPERVPASGAGLVGWRQTADGQGSLVSLAEDGATTIWSAPAGFGEPLAFDADGPAFVFVSGAGAPASGGSGSPSIFVLEADGAVATHDLPAGLEAVSAAAITGGRTLVVAYRAAADALETGVFALGPSGGWEPVGLTGDVPQHQFVERLVAIPETDLLALVLKTPGGVGDRDDELLVLARFEGDSLSVMTPGFADDSLPALSAMWGEEGVVYPRTWRVVEGRSVVDIVAARWDGTAWAEEILLADAAAATGVESGTAVVQGSDGTFWLRAAPSEAHGGGSTLMRVDPVGGTLQPVDIDLSEITWFCAARTVAPAR